MAFYLSPSLEPQDLSAKGYGKQQAEDEDDSQEEDEETDVEMEEEKTASTPDEGVFDTAGTTPADASSSCASAQSVRPQIIVTPRKMASAIESATAAVLAKNQKTSLDECATNEVPLDFMPVCVFGRKGGEAAQRGGKESVERVGSSKTVIVRAGCSSVSFRGD